MNQQIVDEILKDIDSMRTCPDYETRRILFEHIRNRLNSLVREDEHCPFCLNMSMPSKEEKCPICDTYKIEICGCDNHLKESEE